MAMGITQALKLEQGPIDALAKLPQQQLISMAQQGRLPSNILPLVLSEKAQMIQQAANMQAAQQPQPPSVIEQAMATNAQAEAQAQAQAAAQQRAQQEAMLRAQLQERQAQQARMAGIGNLPVPESMYGGGEAGGYAGGGIVAFDDGGEVSLYDLVAQQQAADPYYDTQKNYDLSSVDPSYARAVQQHRALYATPARAELEALYAQEKRDQAAEASRIAKQAGHDKDMRMFEAGLAIMGGESPYFGVNVGKGAQSALKGYAEDVREQRKQEMAARQTKLDLAKKMYELEAGDIAGGVKMREKAIDQDIERQKGKELTQTAQTIFNESKAKGKPITWEEAFSRATMATTRPPDRYTALNNRVIAANKDFASRASILQMQYDQAKDSTAREAIKQKLKDLRDAVMSEYSITASDLNELQKLDRSAGIITSAPSSGKSTGFSGREVTSNR